MIALAVIKAKQAVPQLSFDIYGHGPEKDKIQQIISEHHAEDYIHLRGHVNLDEIYTQYELFVSASQSEGFGLTPSSRFWLRYDWFQCELWESHFSSQMVKTVTY